MQNNIYIITIDYYDKKHNYKKMLTSYINPSIEITKAYVLNTMPTINRNDIYLIDNMTTEKQ